MYGSGRLLMLFRVAIDKQTVYIHQTTQNYIRIISQTIQQLYQIINYITPSTKLYNKQAWYQNVKQS